MALFDTGLDVQKGLQLASHVHRKFKPVFDELSDCDRAALAFYFLPHRSQKDVLEVTRPRVVKWYCPFADQSVFPSGHRYCINVYSGCRHNCHYCYATGYVASNPKCKAKYRADLMRDLNELDQYDVGPAPVHLSNSTDPLQPLERAYEHTLFTLERLAERRHRFTTVTLLTKNPELLTTSRYLDMLHRLNQLGLDHPKAAWFTERGLPPLRIECSLSFLDDGVRRLFEPGCPTVEDRLSAIRHLRAEGLSVFMRIDPLFPRDPLPGRRTMREFGLPDVQPTADLERLIQFAGSIGVSHLVYSVAKITRPRSGSLPDVMEKMKRVYESVAQGEPLVFRGGSWRLPDAVAARQVVDPFLGLCRRHSMAAKMCKANLLSTP